MNYRPCLILGYKRTEFASRWGRFFRRHGWEVHLAANAAEARRLAGLFAPAAVVLDVDLPDESGWLTSAKLTAENPDVKVILVGSKPRTTGDLAEVGAVAWLERDADPDHLLDTVIPECLTPA